MKHFTLPEFWGHYNSLPSHIQDLADKKFKLLKADPHHPSLHFKKVGRELWSARVDRNYRALGLPAQRGIEWFWIGPHDEYEKMLN